MAPKKKTKKKKEQKPPEYDINDIVEPTEPQAIDEKRVALVMAAPDPSASNNIRVAVRVRPPNQRELEGGASNVIIRKSGLTVEVGEGSDMSKFVYDVVLADATQEQAMDEVGVNLVHAAYHGFNSTCFAYGQTSSGKSYSMIGKLGGSTGISEHSGLTPRVATLLFDVARSAPKMHEFLVEASFLEIYNEKVRDLLEPSSSSDSLKIRESPQLGVHITGLTKKRVSSAASVARVLITGFQNRTVSATTYNAESSRSHAIFEICIKQKYVDAASGQQMAKSSKINMVDLAGSERSDKVGTTGAALVEGNNINKSLTVLGRCIKALVDVGKSAPPAPPPGGKKSKKGDKKDSGKVVPFRESILTWYLRESLAGNSRTTMLATVSPVALNREETLSTLRYAASAKNIKTSASKNEDPMEAKVRELAEEIQALKQALSEAKAGGGGGGKGGSLIGDANFLDTLDDEGREAYLVELQSTMRALMPGGFAKQRRTTTMEDIRGNTCYPAISCLNKDDMLSHAMVVPIIEPADGQPFTIGKQGGARENDFVLNGVGMQVRHCVIRLRNEAENKENNTIETCGHAAVVLVNGQALLEGIPRALEHLDRITLGPCRMIALWCEKELTQEEQMQWGYEQAFGELMHQESLQWTLLAPARRRLLDQLKQAEILYVEQANAIAIDMCTPVRFHATVLIGDGVRLLHKAHCTVDDLLFDGTNHDGHVVIVATVQYPNNDKLLPVKKKGKIQRALDALNGSDDEAEEEKIVFDEHTPRAPRHTQSFSLFEKMLSDHTETDDDDLTVGLTPRGQDTKGNAFFNGDDGAGDENALSAPSPRVLARHRKNNTLFEMKMDMFEDLCSEMKSMYGGVSSLCLGISDLADTFEEPSPDNMVVQIFQTICDSDDETITRSDLSAAFNLFDETSLDPGFAERSMLDLLPDDVVSLDFKTFTDFFSKFLTSLFLSKLEPFVSNQSLFVSVGGRDLSNVIHEEKARQDQLALANTTLTSDLASVTRELTAAKREMELLRTRLAQLAEEKLSEKLQAMNVDEEEAKNRPAHKSSTSRLFGSSPRTRNKNGGTTSPRSLRTIGGARRNSSNRNSDTDKTPPRARVSARYSFSQRPPRTKMSQSVDSVVRTNSGSSTSSSGSENTTMESTTTTTTTQSSSSSSKELKRTKDTNETKPNSTIRKGGLRKTPSKLLEDEKKSPNSLSSLDQEAVPVDDDDDASDATSVNDKKDDDVGRMNSFNSEYFNHHHNAQDGDNYNIDLNDDDDNNDDDKSKGEGFKPIKDDNKEHILDDIIVEQIMASDEPLHAFLEMLDLAEFKESIEFQGATMLVELLDSDIIEVTQLKKCGLSEAEIEKFENERDKMRACLDLEPIPRKFRSHSTSARRRQFLNHKTLAGHDAPGGTGGDFAPHSDISGSTSDMSIHESYREKEIEYEKKKKSKKSKKKKSNNDDDEDEDEWKQPKVENMLRQPVLLLNMLSKRKLFAQAGKRPGMFETWAKGFGAGPELKTFKDNKWWLLPVGDSQGAETYVLLNAHSNRKVYAKPLKLGAKWDKECGAVPAVECGMETNWWLVKDEDSGGYIIQNAMSKRKLFARMPHRGEQWAAGVGAAPADHCGAETTWYIVPVSSHANSEEEYDRVMKEHLANQDQAGYGFKSQGLRNWSSQSSNVASTAYSDVSSEYS